MNKYRECPKIFDFETSFEQIKCCPQTPIAIALNLPTPLISWGLLEKDYDDLRTLADAYSNYISLERRIDFSQFDFDSWLWRNGFNLTELEAFYKSCIYNHPNRLVNKAELFSGDNKYFMEYIHWIHRGKSKNWLDIEAEKYN